MPRKLGENCNDEDRGVCGLVLDPNWYDMSSADEVWRQVGGSDHTEPT